MNSPKLFGALLVAIVVVVFGAQNTQAVRFHFLVLNLPSVPLVLPLFAAILLGAVLGWGVAAPGRFRSLRVTRGLRQKIADQDRVAAAVAQAPASPPDPAASHPLAAARTS
ncbi:MAG TPA: LapA family protein [Chloroflexota bacterium]|jgi:uncharacterized integral membrane protein|nr:LapA family protein [Chloroflexota bacterium]